MPRCQNVFLSPLVGLDIFLVELSRTEVLSKETLLPSTKDQPSESRAMRDRYPLVKKSCLCGCPQGNRLGTISNSNLQGWSFLRLLSFGNVWKENNDPLVCSSALCRSHIREAFSLWTDWWWKRASFAIRLSGLFVTSETYVTDLARISRLKQADEIRPDRHAFLPS